MKKSTVALIPAAGLGTRLGLGPKAFVQLNQKTLLEIVLEKITPLVDRVIVALPEIESNLNYLNSKVNFIIGGKTRQETIELLFENASEEIILIHDVARPFASIELFKKVLEEISTSPIVITATNFNVPLMTTEDLIVKAELSKLNTFLPQAPQAYLRDSLRELLVYAKNNQSNFQTLWQIALKLNLKIKILMGEKNNIKITDIDDFEFANYLSKDLI